jgi:hypothetical protein
MISTEQLKKNQIAIREFRAVGCGDCKGTGLLHKWNSQGDMVPTGEVCPTCHGTALAPNRHQGFDCNNTPGPSGRDPSPF